MLSKPAILLLILALSGCVSIPGTGIKIDKDLVNSQELAKSISTLPRMEIDTIENFEQFQAFADNTNALIRILNREGKLEIPEIEKTTDSWEKISKTITEWTPLINNYNEVIDSAKNYNEPNKESEVRFYTEIGSFALETAIIAATSFYQFSFAAVGILFRSTGFSFIAFHCPTCVSAILGSAHWFIRNGLVEEASTIAKPILETLSRELVKQPN